jgi:hypothetical protein
VEDPQESRLEVLCAITVERVEVLDALESNEDDYERPVVSISGNRYKNLVLGKCVEARRPVADCCIAEAIAKESRHKVLQKEVRGSPRRVLSTEITVTLLEEMGVEVDDSIV